MNDSGDVRQRASSGKAAVPADVSTVATSVPIAIAKTITWSELPEWRKDNEYIVTGYRRFAANAQLSSLVGLMSMQGTWKLARLPLLCLYMYAPPIDEPSSVLTIGSLDVHNETGTALLHRLLECIHSDC